MSSDPFDIRRQHRIEELCRRCDAGLPLFPDGSNVDEPRPHARSPFIRAYVGGRGVYEDESPWQQNAIRATEGD